MTNLEILQHICTAVGMAVPENLTDITRPMREVMRVVHETNLAVCGERDWWFLQETGHFRFQEYLAGADADVVGATKVVTTNDGTPFNTTYSRPAKMKIGDAGSDYEDDFLRVEFASTSTATVLGPWERGNLTAQDWIVGHDEYELANDVERISWVVMHYSETAPKGKFRLLRPVSVDELDRIRSSRTEPIWYDPAQGQPEVYCVLITETDAEQNRRLIVDPFPEVNAQVVYGYYRTGADLYGSGEAEPDIPGEHQHILIYKGILDYLTAFGIGTPANSAAGRDVPQLLEFYRRKLAAAKDEMTKHARVAEEQSRLSPESYGRMFYAAQTGRIV